ncbi:hypothetical protein [Corynebacterium sp. sy039]|uniref:hypothetical protein n=1 Tax=Corynebacterium sp. sy039 TaxID=2599641 RepID=UPI00143D7BC7|nr:hypothetical protein [Corynebacterium sp. sy039]
MYSKQLSLDAQWFTTIVAKIFANAGYNPCITGIFYLVNPKTLLLKAAGFIIRGA